VKPATNSHEPGRENPQDLERRGPATEESHIDQVLADSFPASDAPPWTLGVTSVARKPPEIENDAEPEGGAHSASDKDVRW
jgi:hypothetical protein